MSARILIVGCGYVGARVAARLHAAGHQVLAMTRSAERAGEFSARGWSPVIGDVMEPQALTTLPPVEAMLYAVGYDRTAGTPKRTVYIEGFRRVLEAMAGRCRRVVAISSTSVYAQHEGELVDESSATEPTSDSGQICLAAEQVLQAWQTSQNVQGSASLLRLAGIYGPGRMLARAELLRAGQPLSGRGDAWLNLIHGDDAAALAEAALFSPIDSAVWLGVDREPVRRADFYGELARLLNAPPPTFSGLFEPGARGSETGINKRCTNPRTRRDLGVELRFPTYREGLADSVNRQP